MFATLIGGLPAPPVSSTAGDEGARDAIAAVIGAQERAGLDLLSDGVEGLGAGDAVARWQAAAALTDRPVKARLLGPFTASRAGAGRAPELVAGLRAAIDALAAAGCPLVEIEEPNAIVTPADAGAARDFRAMHVELAAHAPVHLSLVLRGGNVDGAGSSTFVDPAYASYAVDLIAGPDNWRLVADIPGDRGVVCGALSARPGSDDSPELLVWAAHYAASTEGRGLDRVGLSNAPGLAALPWPEAVRKLERLTEAARIAALPRTGELAAALDPRATDLKSRALGRRVGRRPTPRSRP